MRKLTLGSDPLLLENNFVVRLIDVVPQNDVELDVILHCHFSHQNDTVLRARFVVTLLSPRYGLAVATDTQYSNKSKENIALSTA